MISHSLSTMESSSRGQPPAWHTKVVHHEPGCLKAGSTGLGGLDCGNDVMSSKPQRGRDMTDALQSNLVNTCGSIRCKTCSHMVVGNSFSSYITGYSYNVVGSPL